MWIAKNDLTGKTYGKPFKDIYDCQKFIDTALLKVQMFYSMALGAENDFLSEREFEKWYKEKYPNNHSIALEFTASFQFALNSLIDGLPRNPRNKVIRCYNVEQERYADGFDF